MSVDTASAPPLLVHGPTRRTLGARRSSRWFRPGWPLAALFVGFPVWWVLGLGDFAFLILAIPMAVDLVHKRRVVTPRAFGAWLLFLTWVVVSVLTLQVSAPGTIAGESGSRYATWTYRLFWYLTVTVALLYVLNNRKALPTVRVARILGWMFVWITIGGLLGVFAPNVQFPSALEFVLPSGLANNGFVNALIHPSFAQLEDVLGYVAPRPSAPFAYANNWGVNFAVFLPFFIFGWARRGSGWRRLAAPVVLGMATIPVIYSLNRGLWLALGAAGIFVAVRAAMTGKPAMFASLLASCLMLVLLVAYSPLGGMVSDRLANPHSNEGRENLSSLAVRSVAAKSPVVGLGSTRTVQGSFGSISASRTAACPRCSPPALGTQGQLWLVMYSQGFLGLFFFLLFLGHQFLTQVRRRGPVVTMGLSVLVMAFVTMPVYNSIGSALFAITVAIALMSRDTVADPSAIQQVLKPKRTLPTLAGIVGVLRQSPRVVLVCVLAGGLVATTWEAVQGKGSVASIGVSVPQMGANPIPASPPLTLDSDARLIYSASVLSAISAAAGRRVSSDDSDLVVTAVPGTRILNISYTAPTAATAKRTVSAAGSALAAAIDQQARERTAVQLRALSARAASLRSTINAQAAVLHTLQTPSPQRLSDSDVRFLRQRTSALRLAARSVSIQTDRLTTRQPAPSQIVQAARTTPDADTWRVGTATGLSLGLLAGLMLAWVRPLLGRRLHRAADVARWTQLPVLGELPSPTNRSSPPSPAELDRVIRSLAAYQPTAFVTASAGTANMARSDLARQLDERLWVTGRSSVRDPLEPRPHVVLVVPHGARARDVSLVHDRLSRGGSAVAGVLFNGRTTTRRPNR